MYKNVKCGTCLHKSKYINFQVFVHLSVSRFAQKICVQIFHILYIANLNL